MKKLGVLNFDRCYLLWVGGVTSLLFTNFDSIANQQSSPVIDNVSLKQQLAQIKSF